MSATFACMSPMGPAPMTSTVSPGTIAIRWKALYTQASGSTSAAETKSAPSGIGARLPCDTASRGIFMKGANPPGMLMPKAL